MNRVIAIIVTYNADIERLKNNLSAIIEQVDDVLIIDNGSTNIKDIQKLTKLFDFMITANKQNRGIAIALNQGLECATLHGFEYALTLDQDSISAKGMVEELKKGFLKNDNIAIVGPEIQDLNKDERIQSSDEFVYVSSLITSGSLCNVAKLKAVGGFDDRLFIDCVDFEICWRLRLNGYLIVKNKNVVLNHTIGKRTKNRFIYRNVYALNHNATRVYYMARNRIYILKKYRGLQGVKFPKELFGLFKRCGGIVLYESDKYNKIISTIKGIRDGILMDS
ncbi:MAG: glycosyltransferase family 2 protein [Candidatus Theseobacter exili]|nr:glycosyltransferase family 2 protein [Candidatus Theseobacter exili]